MTAAEATEWVLPVGLLASVLAGVGMLSVSIRTGWIAKSIALTTIAYGIVGGGLALSPKWEKFVARADEKGFEMRVGQLEEQLKTAQAENVRLMTQISLVSKLNSSSQRSAAEVIKTIDTVASSVEWAKFLPTNPASYKVQVSSDDQAVYSNLGNALGRSPQDVQAAVQGAGLTVLQSLPSSNLSNVPATELWISPTPAGKSQ